MPIIKLIVRDLIERRKETYGHNRHDRHYNICDSYNRFFVCVACANLKSKKSSGSTSASAHCAYSEAITPAPQKSNSLKRLLHSEGFAIVFGAITAAFPVLYYLVGIAIVVGSPYMVILCSPFAILGYFLSAAWYFGIAMIYFAVVLLILKKMNQNIRTWHICNTAIYARTPMFVVNTIFPSAYFSYISMIIRASISIAVTAGLMFFALRHTIITRQTQQE